MEYVPKRYNTDYFRNVSQNEGGILVAVLDTGVDPLAYGLIKCPDGSNKIVDIIDCTGSDIVNTSTIKQLSSLPQKIQDIIKDDIDNQNQIFYGTRSLRTFVSNRQLKGFANKQKKVIEETIFCVYTYKFNDVFCVIIDSDNQVWKMNEYQLKQECGSVDLQEGMFMNFGVHVYKDGKETSLVFDSGSHATHVAGIIASYFKDNEQQNGINPNAKILSLKIGDSRVDGMETSLALCNALNEMVRYNCTLANYSFGESICPNNPKDLSFSGRFIEILEEYAMKHNIIFMTSAGNSGPTLMTVGAPRMCSESAISVGAYTDQKLLNDLYFVSENEFSQGTYEWSSRGPLFNKSMGIDIIAPGCALTSHPQWYKSNMNMCNGTSMACPEATGIVSLVMQNNKNNGRDLPFYWVKKYFENSCKPLDNIERITQGNGLLFSRTENLSKIRTDNYCYKVTSNDGKQFGEFIAVNSNLIKENNGIVVKNLFINISPSVINQEKDKNYNLVNFRKVLHIRHTFDINECELSFPNKIIVDSRGCTVRVQLELNLHNMTNLLSGYLQFYEEDDLSNFVGYYSLNIIKYSDLELSNPRVLNYQLKPGIVNRCYVCPQGNKIQIKFNDPEKYNCNHIFVDIAKITDTDKYNSENRMLESYLTKEKMKDDISMYCVPGNIYEIVTYITWRTGTNMNLPINVSFDVKCCNNIISLNKSVLNVGDYIDSQIYSSDKDEKNVIQKVSINNVITQYYPDSSKLTDDSLELTYKLNKHDGKCVYYVNECNNVYNSDVTMSACLFGMHCNKIMFMGNYVPKMSNATIDTIVIKISDKDKKRLEQYYGLILNVQREFKDKVVNTNYDNNIVRLKVDKKDINDNIYYDDILNCNILNTNVQFINKIKQKDEKKEDDVNLKILNFCKTFKSLNSHDEIVNFLSAIDNEKDNLSFENMPLLLMLQSLSAKKQKFGENKKAPFCAYKFLCGSDKLDDIVDSLDTTIKEINYWNDVNVYDIYQMQLMTLNDKDTENKFAEKKRKLQYLLESDYGY